MARLTVILENGDVPLDDNAADNAIRPFEVGRKNCLFSDTLKGAEASNFIYSLIETAKLNQVEPHDSSARMQITAIGDMAGAASVYPTGLYQRHRPRQSLLYQIVAQHYPTFRDLMEVQGRGLAAYVQREFDDFPGKRSINPV